MKAVCIKNTCQNWTGICYYDLTIGKKYNCTSLIIKDDKDYEYYIKEYYSLVDDTDTLIICPSSFLITLEEYRNRRLEDIGI